MVMAIEAWKEALEYTGIPLSELNDYYLAAFTNRKSTFPMGVDEICSLWRESQHPSWMAPPREM